MLRIWKYEIAAQNEITIEMPQQAEILCVQTQKEIPNIWALVDPDLPSEVRTFTVVKTGHLIENKGPMRYIGSFQLVNGNFVGHLFERV